KPKTPAPVSKIGIAEFVFEIIRHRLARACSEHFKRSLPTRTERISGKSGASQWQERSAKDAYKDQGSRHRLISQAPPGQREFRYQYEIALGCVRGEARSCAR